MGTVFRKTFTKQLPANAEVFTTKGETFAKVKPATGRSQTFPVVIGRDGQQRILIQTKTFVAKYRDGAGQTQTVSTGCREEKAARAVLADLERRAELIRAGVMTAGEDRISEHQGTPLQEHFRVYHDHRVAKGLSQDRIDNTDSRLKRLADECEFQWLSDLCSDVLIDWLGQQLALEMSPGTRNEYRQELVGFGNWCVETKRLITNPFEDVPKANAKLNPRRKRRAMTDEELVKLLYVARWRPLAEHGREPVKKADGEATSKRRTWNLKPLTLENIDDAVAKARIRLIKNPQFIVKQERLGRERALIYKTFVTTGLRRGELASITAGQLSLNTDPPYLTLNAADEKNRQGNSIPLRADLADELRSWLAEKFESATQAFNETGGSSSEPVFRVPEALLKILNRDLESAGIPKRDDRGWTLDVHALRHTFGTMLSRSGVSPRTAMSAMRHSSIDLTMNLYTDPRLLDVQGAVEALPTLQLKTSSIDAADELRSPPADCQLAPMLAPDLQNLVQAEPATANTAESGTKQLSRRDLLPDPKIQTKKPRPDYSEQGFIQWRRRESNPRPLHCERSALPTELRPLVDDSQTLDWPSGSRQCGRKIGQA